MSHLGNILGDSWMQVCDNWDISVKHSDLVVNSIQV